MSEKRIAAKRERDLAIAAAPINLRRILDVCHPKGRVRMNSRLSASRRRKNPWPSGLDDGQPPAGFSPAGGSLS
jgi:hypothetical protein